MQRRSFLRRGTVFIGGAFGSSVALSLGANCAVAQQAGSLRQERWLAPSSITPLQCYAVVAQEKGFFRSEGLDITIQATPGTATAVTQLIAGAGMFAQSGSIATVPAIANRGAEIITVAQVIYRSVFELASPADRPIKTGDSLTGKTIGLMSVGGQTDQLLDAMAASSGTDPKSIKRVVTGLSAGAYAYLQRKQVDAFFSFYPVRLALEAQNIPLHYLNTDDVAPIPPDSVIIPKRALASESDRAAVIGYLRAISKSLHFLLDPANFDDAISMLAKYNPVEVQDKALARKKFAFIATLMKRPPGVEFMHCDDAAWQKGVSLLEKIGMIKPGARPLSDYYTNDLVRRI